MAGSRAGGRARLRATNHRPEGVRQMFGALDLATGQMLYRFRGRKRWQEFLGFLGQLRGRFAGKLYVVCDNFSPHKKCQVTDWCADHDVELVFAPAHASWLNWIECEFAALRYFTSMAATTRSCCAAGRHRQLIRWRNQRTMSKKNFVGSKIRRPDYLPKAA